MKLHRKFVESQLPKVWQDEKCQVGLQQWFT